MDITYVILYLKKERETKRLFQFQKTKNKKKKGERKMKKIIIEKENLEESGLPLFRQYDGQCNPQGAYITIAPGEKEIIISADYDHEIGSGHCSFDEFNNIVKSISCPECVLGCSLIEYLESEDFQEKIQDLCEGYEEGWNGNNNVGIWKNEEESDTIIRAIEAELLDLEEGEVFDGQDWIEDGLVFFDEDGEEVDYLWQASSAEYEKIPVIGNN